MSTRACYTFRDQHNSYHVYKHHDGYPTGAAKWLMNARGVAWGPPRYEADDFAAAFVAANKTCGGGIRLMHSGNIMEVAPPDIAYRYEVYPGHVSNILRVAAYSTHYWGDDRKESLLFDCELSDIEAKAEEYEASK